MLFPIWIINLINPSKTDRSGMKIEELGYGAYKVDLQAIAAPLTFK